MKSDREELERMYQQLAEERGTIAQQFQAEAELCAETEEVFFDDFFGSKSDVRLTIHRIPVLKQRQIKWSLRQYSSTALSDVNKECI